jgi:hypothetical protein
VTCFTFQGHDREPEAPRQRKSLPCPWCRLSKTDHRGRDAMMTDDTFPANTRRDDFAVYRRFSCTENHRRQFHKRFLIEHDLSENRYPPVGSWPEGMLFRIML